jgi:peptide subunit release factor 1 (eRF1)
MITNSINHLLNAFDHLIELLQDEGADVEVISMVENAKELLEEEHGAAFDEDDGTD